MLRNAEVAKMFPWVPAAMTAREAMQTMKSGTEEEKGKASVIQGPRGGPVPCVFSKNPLPKHRSWSPEAPPRIFKWAKITERERDS